MNPTSRPSNLIFGIIFLLLLLTSLKVFAAPIEIHFNPGLPLVFVDANDKARHSLGSKLALGIEVTKQFESLPVCLGAYYQGYFGGDYGPLPVNHNGISVSYYPFGTPTVSKNLDGNVEVFSWRPAVFIRTGAGLTFLNIRDLTHNVVFGASAFNYQLAGGMDYPITHNVLLGAEALYVSTFGGSAAEDATITVGVTGFVFSARLGFIWE